MYASALERFGLGIEKKKHRQTAFGELANVKREPREKIANISHRAFESQQANASERGWRTGY